MKILALLLLFGINASACTVDLLDVCDSKLTGIEIFQITESLCDIYNDNDSIVMHKIKGNWARALVNHKEIVYLNKANKWKVAARANKFDINDWNKYSIPDEIR